ncbi:MAG: phosphotransferase [Chloroflexi bacterium]|nr:phosphotransferase [Chloroflexota bacterium]
MLSESFPTEVIVPQSLLLELLRQALGSRVELVDCKIGNRHHDYLVLLVQVSCPSTQVVVKLAGPDAPIACPFDRTAMFHRLVAAKTTIRMPEVLAVDVSYKTWPWRYFIKEHIPGEEWARVRDCMNAHELSEAYQQIGNAVAQLHTIHFPTFGQVAADGSVQSSDTCAAAVAERARLVIKDVRRCNLFLETLNQRADLFANICDASLCHEDLHQHNLLFQQQQGRWCLATILDFDKAWAGHYESDLARLEFWRGMTSKEFWSAYLAIRPVDPLYNQRRLVYQFLWCLEYAKPTKEHLADTQRLCEELGLEHIEHF